MVLNVLVVLVNVLIVTKIINVRYVQIVHTNQHLPKIAVFSAQLIIVNIVLLLMYANRNIQLANQVKKLLQLTQQYAMIVKYKIANIVIKMENANLVKIQL